MYDLNLAVPDFTSAKYSQDNRFLLLKNYLYELNDILSYALTDDNKTQTEDIKKGNQSENIKENQSVIRLKNDTKKQLQSLTEKIQRTAEEINEALYKNKVEMNLELARQLGELLVEAEGVFLPRVQGDMLMESINEESAHQLKKHSDSLRAELERIERELELFRKNTAGYIEAEQIYLRKGMLDEGVYGVEIGSEACGIKARISSQGVSFFRGECEVAYVYDGCLYAEKGAFLDTLTIGRENESHFILRNTLNGLEVLWADAN